MPTTWADLNRLEPRVGRLLVATPVLGDPNFARTVVYLLEHDANGTVGVVLNRPSHTPVAHVLPRWEDAVSGPAVVFGGGPVQPDGALCLAALDGEPPGVRAVIDDVVTVDLDGDVAAIAAKSRHIRVFAGHSGWGGGQLEAEMEQAAWWVVAGSGSDLFSEEPEGLWRAVLRRQPPPLRLLSTYPPDTLLN